MSTDGFYKLDGEVLLHGPNFVINAAYELRRDNKDNLSFPVDGWYWFDSIEDARAFFGLPEPEPEPEPDPNAELAPWLFAGNPPEELQ